MLGRLRHTGMIQQNSCITKASVWLYLNGRLHRKHVCQAALR